MYALPAAITRKFGSSANDFPLRDAADSCAPVIKSVAFESVANDAMISRYGLRIFRSSPEVVNTSSASAATGVYVVVPVLLS